MRRNVRIAVAASAAVLFWAGVAYDLSRPADYDGYRRTVLQVAGTAYDAAQTGRLVGEQLLAGRVTKPYAVTAFDDAETALAGAQRKFTSQPPPGDRARRLRDEVAPMLAGAVAALADTAEAADRASRRAGVRALGEVSGRLDAFVTAHR
jgi:hypothetical protein